LAGEISPNLPLQSILSFGGSSFFLFVLADSISLFLLVLPFFFKRLQAIGVSNIPLTARLSFLTQDST